MDRRTFNASIAAALACTALPRVNYNAAIDTSFRYGVKDVTWSRTYPQFVYDSYSRDNFSPNKCCESHLSITFFLDSKCTQERMIKFTGKSFTICSVDDNLKRLNWGNNSYYYEMRELNIFKLGTKIKVNAHKVLKGESYDIELISSGNGEVSSLLFYNHKLENIVN